MPTRRFAIIGLAALLLAASVRVGGAAPWAAWLTTAGAAQRDEAYAVALDPSGDLLVAGGFNGAVQFGGTTLTSSGGRDGFLAKLDGDSGAALWAVRFGGTGDDAALGVASTAEGDAALTGYRTNSSTSIDIVVERRAGGTGAPMWTKQFGASGTDIGVSVDVGGGTVAVTGYYTAAFSFGGPSLPAANARDAYVAALDVIDGSYRWSRGFGSGGFDQGYGIAADFDGSVAMTGIIASSVSAGGAPLPFRSGSATHPYDIVVARYSASGAHVWSRSFGGTRGDYGESVTIDGTGDVYVGGAHEGDATFDSITLPTGTFNGFVARLAGADGSARWAVTHGGGGFDDTRSIALTGAGTVAAAGFVSTGATVGSCSIDVRGGTDAYWAALDAANGSPTSCGTGGGSGNDVATGITAAPGEVVAAGSFEGAATFAGRSATSAGGKDAFAVRLTDDLLPPSGFVTSLLEAAVPPLLERATSGIATDDLSGVGSVTVSYTAVVGGATTTAPATLSCSTPAALSCTWRAAAPALPGPYLAALDILDRAGNAVHVPGVLILVV